MKLRRSTVFLFCLALLASVFALGEKAPVNVPPQASTSSFQQELINTQKAFLDALERGDAGYAKNAVADDFLLITPTGDTAGKQDVVHEIHPSPEPGPKPILYDFNVVQLDADCAVVSYKAVFLGGQTERYQFLSNTWVKQGGQWKLKFQQSTLNLWSAHDL
jgi:hypothetical protein